MTRHFRSNVSIPHERSKNITYNTDPRHRTTSEENPSTICGKDVMFDELMLGKVVAGKLYLASVQ
jgi:hypothetical protein